MDTASEILKILKNLADLPWLAILQPSNRCQGGRKRVPRLRKQQATKAKSRQAGRAY
jgi:hypothetical protein